MRINTHASSAHHSWSNGSIVSRPLEPMKIGPKATASAASTCAAGPPPSVAAMLAVSRIMITPAIAGSSRMANTESPISHLETPATSATNGGNSR